MVIKEIHGSGEGVRRRAHKDGSTQDKGYKEIDSIHSITTVILIALFVIAE